PRLYATNRADAGWDGCWPRGGGLHRVDGGLAPGPESDYVAPAQARARGPTVPDLSRTANPYFGRPSYLPNTEGSNRTQQPALRPSARQLSTPAFPAGPGHPWGHRKQAGRRPPGPGRA